VDEARCERVTERRSGNARWSAVGNSLCEVRLYARVGGKRSPETLAGLDKLLRVIAVKTVLDYVANTSSLEHSTELPENAELHARCPHIWTIKHNSVS